MSSVSTLDALAARRGRAAPLRTGRRERRARSCRTSARSGGRSRTRSARCCVCLREALHRVVVEAEVEDGVHHPGHRERRTRTHRHEQRVVGVAEPLAHLRPRAPRARRATSSIRPSGSASPRGHVGVARVGGDREAGRHGQAEVRHLGEVRALAAEQELLLLAALFERVDVLRRGLAPTSTNLSSARSISAGVADDERVRRTGRAGPACSGCASTS